MNKHLKIFLTITGTLMLFVLGSCKKFLNQQPITEVGPELVFSDVNSTRQAVAGVYSRLVGDQAYGIRISLYYAVDNDEMQGPTGATDNDRRDISRYAATAGNLQLRAPFYQLFQGIEYANICIDKIPKMSLYSGGSEQEKKQLQRLHGEALTLRAQFYLEAIRNWGDVPSHFQPAYILAAADPFPRRVDRDTLYNQLLEDLKLAATLVPWVSEVASIGDTKDERITKGTVKALRARIALFAGGYSLRQDGTMKRRSDYLTLYQIARDETNEVITSGQHALNPNFRSLWKDQVGARVVADLHGELMFQASGIGKGGAGDTKLGYYNGPTVNNFGNKAINVLPTYFYSFDPDDARRDVTCVPYNVATDGVTKIPTAITAINDGKYRRDWISNPAVSPTDAIQYFSAKWQILRYSDVLLMFAEAENELNGPTGPAYNAINMVRRRGFSKPISVGDPTVDLSGLNKASFFTALVKERSLELGGEGVRKYDLIRWNMLGSKIAETKAALTAMSTLAAPYNNLPIAMYFKNNSTADDASIWLNSFYVPAPTATPAGTTKVTWLSAAIVTTVLTNRFASGYTPGKSELLPIPQEARDANKNLTQNPGY